MNLQRNIQSKKLPTPTWNNSTNINSKRQNKIITTGNKNVKDNEIIYQKQKNQTTNTSSYTSIELDYDMKIKNILQTNIAPVTITDTLMKTKSEKLIQHQAQ